MDTLTTEAQIDALTEEQAIEILHKARHTLIEHLQGQDSHPHLLDDCGDYLNAATLSWGHLFEAFWSNDGDPVRFTDAVKAYLRFDTLEELACDGDTRFEVLSEELRESLLINRN